LTSEGWTPADTSVWGRYGKEGQYDRVVYKPQEGLRAKPRTGLFKLSKQEEKELLCVRYARERSP
jgi:hypothetical protein